MSLFPRIAEQKMLDALEDGAFDNLPGAGRPIADLNTSDGLDPVTRAGYRIMSEAGALPEELQLRNLLRDARAELARATDPEERARLGARVADLGLRHAMAQEARLRGR
ncbi:DnaJ family domain-containing protein [Roseivivax sp.]